jgi:hypothetical protein
MIRRRTVFVLGAGSSAPYGFSTGTRLLQSAREMSVEQMSEATEGRFQPGQMNPIHNALQDTVMSSIDAMLQHQPNLWPALKGLMAALLLDEEEKALTTRPDVDEDWLALIVENMATDTRTIEDFARNPASFVTFNYDRLLEYRLGRGLAQHYAIPRANVWQHLGAIPIIHVHGSLGLLPEQRAAHGVPPIPFGAPENPEYAHKSMAVGAAVQGTKIVHEVADNEQSFMTARHFLQQADQVVFLGFSFGADNVRHLGTHDAIPRAAHVYCTTYKMTAAEVRVDVIPVFDRPTVFQHDDMPARQFLREHIDVLR